MILIAFRHSDRRLFARLVVALRGGDSAHVESCVPIEGTRLAMCVSSSFVDGGVRGKVIDVSDSAKWRVYRWEGMHVDLQAWLADHYGVAYDTFGMLGIEFPIFRQSKGKMFCVEASGAHIHLDDAHKYDLVEYERYVKQRAPRVEWFQNEIVLRRAA